MRICVHDYVGHPFQIQLSRGLAGRGHEVLHLYSGSYVTPHGDLGGKADDSKSLTVEAINLSQTIAKYSFVNRYRMEREYAGKLARRVDDFQPEVVLAANTPTVIEHRLLKQCQTQGCGLVTWVQDLYGLAAYRILKRKLPIVGHLVGQYFMWLDRQSYRGSAANIVITEDFEEVLAKWGAPKDRIHTIHNWAPLDTLPLRPRENAWAESQGLSRGLRFLYSGTLSIRHDPSVLLRLAKLLRRFEDAELIVISEGSGIDWLQTQAVHERLTNIRFLPFQPFETMADVFGSADVLIALLEADAGIYCVPSKILSYMCAGRPLLLSVPKENLSARIVEGHGCGLVVQPQDSTTFLEAAQRLGENQSLREMLGDNARLYAEQNFDFETICDRFEEILVGRGARPLARRQASLIK